MNQVAVRRGGAVAALSGGLAAAVAHWRAPDPHGGARVRVLSPPDRSEAARALAEMEAQAAPASVATVRKWLLMIAAGVNNVPAAEDFGPRAAAVAMACCDLPGWGFSDATAREALRRFKWFPSAAEVCALIAEATHDGMQTAAALRALLASPPAAPPPPVAIGAAERHAVACGLRGLVTEMQARARTVEGVGGAREAVRASPLPPDVLAGRRDANPIVQAARAKRGGR